MLRSLSVKLKEQNVKLARLAKVLRITRPTLYRYIELFDQNKKDLIPKQALLLLSQLHQKTTSLTKEDVLSIPGSTPSDLFRKQPNLKAALIKVIQQLDDVSDLTLMEDLMTTLTSGKSRSLLHLVKRLSGIANKQLTTGKLEIEVEWLLDYILHKYNKSQPNERFFK
jgi:hypothetical protein